MKSSLLYQLKTYGEHTLVTIGILLASPFYILLITPHAEEVPFMFPMMSYMFLFLFSLIFSQTLSAIHTQMALSMGVTRRHWHIASFFCRLLYVLVCVLFHHFIVNALSQRVLGVAVIAGAEYFPLVLSASMLLACLGCLSGYLAVRYGAKRATILYLVLILAFVGICFLVAFNIHSGKIPALLGNPLLPLVLLTLAAVMEFFSWRLLRQMSVNL